MKMTYFHCFGRFLARLLLASEVITMLGVIVLFASLTTHLHRCRVRFCSKACPPLLSRPQVGKNVKHGTFLTRKNPTNELVGQWFGDIARNVYDAPKFNHNFVGMTNPIALPSLNVSIERTESWWPGFNNATSNVSWRVVRCWLHPKCFSELSHLALSLSYLVHS